MRRLINIVAITGSCCLLLLAASCGLDQPQTPQTEDANRDVKDTATPITLPTDQAPVINIPTSPGSVGPGPAILPPGAGGGGAGGGSQGSQKKADTGNPDNDPRAASEIIRDDNIDNDGDTLVDCADPNCIAKPCNDMNGCTVNDVCTDGICTGLERDCEAEVGNECTDDNCEPIDLLNDTYRCVSTFIARPCTPEGNCAVALAPDGSCPDVDDECIIGTCVIVTNEETNEQTFECQDSNLANLTPEEAEGGCNDENPCTADMCNDGACLYSSLSGVLCDDGNSCTNLDICNDGVCVGDEVPNICETALDCQFGFACTSQAGICQEDGTTVGPICFDDTDCVAPAICIGAILGPCACDDGNTCTTPDTCDDGECVGTIPPVVDPPTVTCTDEDPCTSDVCEGDTCVSTPLPQGSDCDDGIECTLIDVCDATGNCVGEPDSNVCDPDNVCQDCMCTVDNGCECELITGPSEDNCDLVLTNLSLTADLLIDLNALGIDLTCDIGLVACLEGVVGACELSGVFAAACTGETLNTACATTVFTLAANTELTTTLCAELQTLATP